MAEAEGTGGQAYQMLYEAIAQGKIKPGDRLRESELAKLVGLSRTPVREAIRRLETDGIVDHKPRIGAVVRTLSQQEVVELYEMRLVLETTAARMAAKHASSAETRKLEDLNAQMAVASGKPRKVAALNQQFHICIVHAARNRYLAQSHRAFSSALILLGDTTLETPERVTLVVEQHQRIIEALKAGDAEEAALAMTDHMEASLDHRLKGIS